jgi:hypothetical protein
MRWRGLWLWRGWVPLGGLTTLEGDPGLGKSALSLQIAAHVTTGRPLPGGTDLGGPANVALINGEDALASVIVPRLRAAGADLSRVLFVEGWRQEGEDPDGAASLSLPRDSDRLSAWLAREEVRLVVIDPLFGFVGRCPVGAPRGQRAALAGLHENAREHGYAVLGIRHWNKKARLSGTYRGLGSRLRTRAESRMIQMAADPALAEDEALIQVAVDPECYCPDPPLVVKRTDVNGQLVVRLGAARPDLHIPVRLPGIAGRPAHELRRAEGWLKARLAGGPAVLREVKEAAVRAGISYPTLLRAKERLGVRREGNCWVLPG